MTSNEQLSKDDLSGRSWHSESIDETVEALASDRESGLDDEEAGRRLELFRIWTNGARRWHGRQCPCPVCSRSRSTALTHSS